jgi:hypothetical protein
MVICVAPFYANPSQDLPGVGTIPFVILARDLWSFCQGWTFAQVIPI